jgi:hypothetical protein
MSKPFALYKKGELHYIGMHKDEADCWKVALGWPSPEEIEWEKKTNVLICLPVRVIAPADRLGSVRCPRCWEMMSAPAAPAPVPLTQKELERICYEHTKLNPNLADDRELVGYVTAAMRAAIAASKGGGNGS